MAFSRDRGDSGATVFVADLQRVAAIQFDRLLQEMDGIQPMIIGRRLARLDRQFHAFGDFQFEIEQDAVDDAILARFDNLLEIETPLFWRTIISCPRYKT